jgi:hypothetical protein
MKAPLRWRGSHTPLIAAMLPVMAGLFPACSIAARKTWMPAFAGRT